MSTKTKKYKILLKPEHGLNAYLDRKFKHCLMGICDSWSEVKYKIRLDSHNQECWWDLEVLLLHFAERLNSSNMSNPDPQWPSDPFTNVEFKKERLINMYDKIQYLDIEVNLAVKEFFKYLNSNMRYVKINKFSSCFIKFLEKKYRFKVINCIDSQENYMGYWVDKAVPESEFELNFKEYMTVAPFDESIGSNELIETHEFQICKAILNSLPAESIDFSERSLVPLRGRDVI